MLGAAASDSFAPHPKTAGFHLSPHQFDDLFFFEAKLQLDRVKRGAVFPRHFDDAIAIGAAQVGKWLTHNRAIDCCGWFKDVEGDEPLGLAWQKMAGISACRAIVPPPVFARLMA
jgi:hypothetical protein